MLVLDSRSNMAPALYFKPSFYGILNQWRHQEAFDGWLFIKICHYRIDIFKMIRQKKSRLKLSSQNLIFNESKKLGKMLQRERERERDGGETD